VGGGSPQAGGNEEGVVVPISGLTPGAPRFLSAFLSDVACQDASHCFAVGESSADGTAAVVPITDGQPGSAQTVGQPNPATSLELLGVACAPATTSCLAVGQQFTHPSAMGPAAYDGVAVPISNGTAGAVHAVSSVPQLAGVACKSATSCLAAGSVPPPTSDFGRLVPIDVGGSAGAAKSETPRLSGVACWSAASCVAVGDDDVFLIGSATPSRSVVTAAVANALAVTGPAARISAVVHAAGYQARVSVPEAGKLTNTWYFLPPGAHLARMKPSVVARGAKTFTAAGSATLRLRLTSRGRALLKHAKHIKLTAVGSFTPKTGATVTKRRAITLTAH
jgi:hypothetical protein